MNPLIETVIPSDVSRVVLSCLVEIAADEKSLASDSKPATPKPFPSFVSHQSDKETDFGVPPMVGVMDLKEKGVRGVISSELGFGKNRERVAGVERGFGRAPERVRGGERRAESEWGFDFVVAITISGENPEKRLRNGS